MKRYSSPEVWLLILIPLIIAPLLGLFPRPPQVARAMVTARQALESGASLKAAEELVLVATNFPWRTGLWDQAGRAALAGGDPQLAQEYLGKARALGMISQEGFIALGDAFQQTGDLESAVETWRSALGRYGPSLEVYSRLVPAHRLLKDYVAAIEDLKAITQLDPTDAGSRYQLGLMLAAQEPEASLAYLLQAMDLNEDLTDAVRLLERNIRKTLPTDEPAYTLLNAGRALAFLGEWGLAEEAFSQATEINPGYAEAWAFLGEAQQKTGEEGLEALQKALDLAPDSFTVQVLAALYWKRVGKYDFALVHLYAAAAADPENPAAQAEIGSTLEAMGNIHAALSHYRQATELAPRDPVYWHLLGLFSIRNGVQVEEIGLVAARQALLLDKEDPVALDIMGYGYFMLNDLITARRFLVRALQADPAYAPVHLHLGLLNMSEGEADQAYRHLSQAIQLAPGTSTGRQAQRILNRYFP